MSRTLPEQRYTTLTEAGKGPTRYFKLVAPSAPTVCDLIHHWTFSVGYSATLVHEQSTPRRDDAPFLRPRIQLPAQDLFSWTNPETGALSFDFAATDSTGVLIICEARATLAPTSPPGIAEEVFESKTFVKHMEHLRYLKEVSTGERRLISQETADLARRAWHLIWLAADGQMPVPAACTGPDGQMLYAWDREQHHLELEIIPGAPAEFFYRNRQTRELWSKDYNVGDPIPGDAIEKFRCFV